MKETISNPNNPKSEVFFDWYQGELIAHFRDIFNDDTEEIISNGHITKSGRSYDRIKLRTFDQSPIDFWRYQDIDCDMAYLCIVPIEENPTSMTFFSIRKTTIQERQQKKVDRIMKWAEGREQFGMAFTWQMRDLLSKGTKLKPNQEQALDNIIDKWQIRDVRVEKK